MQNERERERERNQRLMEWQSCLAAPETITLECRMLHAPSYKVYRADGVDGPQEMERS